MEKQSRSEELLIPHSSDEYGHSGLEADSDEDPGSEYRRRSVHAPEEMLPTAMGAPSGGRLGPLPTISVTPHSPANKTYPVLEDSLQQVRELHESVQIMRTVAANNGHNAVFVPNSRDFAALALNPLLAQMARLSSSCPTLNEAPIDTDILGGSLGSSPIHQPPSRKGSGTQEWLSCVEPHRRRSWTALEDLTKDKGKHTRQRSISLSSMESEADESSLMDMVDGSTTRLLGPGDPVMVLASGRHHHHHHHRGTHHRGSTGGASTHSLNEADLQNDFNKLKAKREAEQLRLLPLQRLPLQKSISTPSIIAARDLAPEPALAGAQPTLPMSRPSGTESETEEESGRPGDALHHHRHHHHPHSIAHLHHVAYDRSEKRRKRGSLFFRKKKDKSKKIAHQWMSSCYGSSQICDVCNKPLSNKPALYCESCCTTVHQNTCKDSIGECSKPKGSKNVTKISGFAASLTNTKNSISKRGSASGLNSGNQIGSSAKRSQLCYSPWRRVATKLGVNQILYDDKDIDSHHGHHHDSACFPDDVPLVPLEFLSDSPLTAKDLSSNPSLGLHETEPDSWTPYVGKDVSRKLKEKEVKRQEHIYEFILTEKHHVMTLLIMKKIFLGGLEKYFQLGHDLERMFPRLDDLIRLHESLLLALRQRQKQSPVVSSISDILLSKFSSHGVDFKDVYGEFCSRHRNAVDTCKFYMQSDPRFSEFVRHCQTNPLLKKKGISECILFVTQRLTKYPLLIEPLIKTSKENKQEQDVLHKALALIKEILQHVNAKVADKEKETRKLEIYNYIDAKSSIDHRGHKFKKSDILQGNRSLKFEGVAMLMQPRAKMQEVLVIVLSDVLFFLQENSHNKYTFFTPESKAGVVSLQKLLVREIAGQDRGIYLISSNPDDPEMFELKVQKPKDKHLWIQAIRDAVQNCPEVEEDNIALSSDEKQTLLNAKQNHIRHLVGLLRQKDIEQALLLEEKMSLQLKLLAAAGLEPPCPPSYRHLVSDNADPAVMWKEVLNAVQEVSHLASSLYATGTNLSRSVSSAGEHQSETYVSPILPKRAETFGGFDNSNQGPFKIFGRKLQSSGCTPVTTPDLENLKPGDSRLMERLPYRNLANGNTEQLNVAGQQPQLQAGLPDGPVLFTLGREQQLAAVQLTHYIYTLLCIISQMMTTNESLQAKLATLRGGAEGCKQYRHNQQLEELRNLQDKLSIEKTAWAAAREQEEKDLEEKRTEVQRLQEQVRAEQEDIKQQREQLYRKMEVLTSQGLLISPNMPLPVQPGPTDDASSSRDTSEDSSPASSDPQSPPGPHPSTTLHHSASNVSRKESKWSNKSNAPQKTQLPLNLLSTTNQAKVSQGVSIKQQIPMKLASRLSTTSTGSTGGPQQIIPRKLSQEDKVTRRTSTSGSTSMAGYQRLESDSMSPPSGETTPTVAPSHSRTGSSPAMMQIYGSSGGTFGETGEGVMIPGPGRGKEGVVPSSPHKNRRHKQTSPGNEEEVIYF